MYASEFKPIIQEQNFYLHTPHLPPSFAQCLQYLQFLHAWHGSAPVQVDEYVAKGRIALPRMTASMKTITGTRKRFALDMVVSVWHGQICGSCYKAVN